MEKKFIETHAKLRPKFTPGVFSQKQFEDRRFNARTYI